jgi:hypothetical protein
VGTERNDCIWPSAIYLDPQAIQVLTSSDDLPAV